MDKEKCCNYYIGGHCNNDANPKNVVLDGCNKPLVYCDECWENGVKE